MHNITFATPKPVMSPAVFAPAGPPPIPRPSQVLDTGEAVPLPEEGQSAFSNAYTATCAVAGGGMPAPKARCVNTGTACVLQSLLRPAHSTCCW